MNIDQLARLAVAGRGEGVLHPRSLRGYETQAERLVTRYVDLAGGPGYDKDVLRRVVEDCHSDLERGAMSEWAFGRIRRVAADIEDVADYGAVGNDLLPKWGKERNPLNRPVSDEAKRDRDDVVGLAARALDLMVERGYSQHTVSDYKRTAFPCLIRFFSENGATTRYSDEALDSYLEEMAAKDDGLGGMPAYRRIAALHVRSVRETGELHERSFFGYEKSVMGGPFADVLSEYGEWAQASGLAPRTVKMYRNCVAIFLCELQALGLADLSSLAREDVRAARATIDPGKSPKYVRDVLSALRNFARFAEEAHPEIPPFAGWLGRAPKARRTMPKEGYSREQSDEMVASVDESRKAGLRDRAMMTAGKNMGLRGIDIRRLKLSDIDWHENRVTIAQSKTGRGLSLPLDKETGEAIASYILESRRKDCDDDTVFLTVVGKPGPVTQSRLHGIVRTYAKPVVGDGFTGLHGPHAFRRGLGKAMVEAGVSLDDAAEVLGHASAESTGPYVAVALSRTAICAAGLDDVPTDGIWWLR